MTGIYGFALAPLLNELDVSRLRLRFGHITQCLPCVKFGLSFQVEEARLRCGIDALRRLLEMGIELEELVIGKLLVGAFGGIGFGDGGLEGHLERGVIEFNSD